MNTTARKAFISTLPVMTGYLVLGFGFGPALASALIVALLHVWRRNTLISILGGTLCYMMAVQFLF